MVIYGPHGPDTADQAAVELEQDPPLRQRQRQVLWLCLVADFSEAGAAEILGLSTGSVKTPCDPIVSIGLAHFWLDEKLATSPAGIAGEVASLLIMIADIVVLAHHAPTVTRQLQEAADSSQESAARLRHRD